jgi:hypothetical protein
MASYANCHQATHHMLWPRHCLKAKIKSICVMIEDAEFSYFSFFAASLDEFHNNMNKTCQQFKGTRSRSQLLGNEVKSVPKRKFQYFQ